MISASQIRRPLVGIAVSVAAGLWIGYGLTTHLLLFFAAFAIFAAVLCRRCSSLGLYAACLLLAAAYGAMDSSPNLQPSLSILKAAEAAGAEQRVAGRVTSEPVVKGGICSFRFQTEAVLLNGEWIKCRRPLKVYLKNSAAPVRYGQRWKLSGALTSYSAVRRTGVGFINVSSEDAKKLSEAPPSLMGGFHALRSKGREQLSSSCPAFDLQTRILNALILGYRQALPASLHRMFSSTGTLHVFAISGLHVGVVAAILIAVLKAVGVSRRIWGLFLIPALLVYVCSTGMKPSALRAFTMAAVYFIAPLVGRRPDIPSSISLAAILLLMMDPGQIKDPGFLLSFTVVSGIVMAHGFAARKAAGLCRSAWALPLARLNGPHPLAFAARSLGLLAITSLAAWLFSMPLTARFFNTVSPVALFGNLLIIPLTFFIVLTACLTLSAAALFPQIAEIFHWANYSFVHLLVSFIEMLSGIPGAWRFVQSPPLVVLAGWYGGLVLALTGPVRIRRWAVVLLAGTVFVWGIRGSFSSSDGIRVVSCQDAAMAVELPDRGWILLSDGNSFYTDRTIQMLREQGVNRLHELVITDRYAEEEAIDQLRRVFRPDSVRAAHKNGRLCWPAGRGEICLP